MIVSVASFSGLLCVTSILHLNWSDHRLMFALKRPSTSPTSFLGMFTLVVVELVPRGGDVPAMARVVELEVGCVSSARFRVVLIAFAIASAAALLGLM